MRPVEKLFADQFMRDVIARNAGEPEFHQAVKEVVESLVPVMERHPKYLDHRILERIVEPERVILFRVPWMDDRGEIHVNKGYRFCYVIRWKCTGSNGFCFVSSGCNI